MIQPRVSEPERESGTDSADRTSGSGSLTLEQRLLACIDPDLPEYRRHDQLRAVLQMLATAKGSA